MKTFATLAFVFALVNASPVAEVVEKDVGSLEKRDTEIIYLANCVKAVSCCVPNVDYSDIIVSLHSLP